MLLSSATELQTNQSNIADIIKIILQRMLNMEASDTIDVFRPLKPMHIVS